MADSDQKPERWPQKERRRGPDRRSGRDRRTAAITGPLAAGEERRASTRRAADERRDERGWLPLTFDTISATGFSPEQSLLAAAVAARAFAQAHYSKFKVGAALETAGGAVITGCNIENATYGLTICAERVAMFKALSEGHRQFRRIAIAADTDRPTPPCGACRQILWEFSGDLEIILANLRRETGRHQLADLLPQPFDKRNL